MMTSADEKIIQQETTVVSANSNLARWILFGALCLVLSLSVTSRTFWIDEAWTAHVAHQPTFGSWWHELREEKVSDIQMPLYCLWIWSCEKFFGNSEIAFRAVNFLWFIPALLVLFRAAARNKTFQTAVFLVAALSPFAWYYLNEARSYTMQVSTSLFLSAVLYHWHSQPELLKRERWWVIGFCVGLILLCGSSLLSMIFGSIPILVALVLLPRERLFQLARDFRAIWLGTLGILFALGLYYLWTLKIGARATSIATTDWKNPLFISYELLGFSGLGPGRLEIRQGGIGEFKTHFVQLGFYAAVVGGLILFAVVQIARQFDRKKLCGLFLSFALPIGFVLAAGAVLHFRVLGRHFAAIAPLAFFLLASGITAAWQRGKVGKILVFTFFGFYLASALMLRFSSRHLKDDYRSAATVAKAALQKGEKVWWNADELAAEYYQVPLSETLSSGKALLVRNPDVATLARERPDVVIASKPDIYDSQNLLPGFFANTGFVNETNFPAFTIWKRTLR